MAQRFLHAGKHRLVVACLDIDDPISCEPGLGQGRRKKIRLGDAPENLAARAGRNAGREQGAGRAIDRAVATAGHLMQRPQRQTTARKPVVDLSKAEGQHLANATSSPLDPFDTGPELGKTKRSLGHVNWVSR
ncbi:hypothetical protein SAMN04487976_11993 [Xaviernesmea oryzae]|nr:hypothetical protein SAMN04487976_11993 [Xaviernesmea oryzae]